MARRKQLKGIANNLVQWSMSRNFDYQGYWAVGQFYAHVDESISNELVVDLVEDFVFIEPENRKFCTALSDLSRVMKNELESNKIPDWWIEKARVTFRFNEEYQSKYHFFGSALGKPFVCSVELKSDLGETYKKEGGCNVWIHNPKRESRRISFN